MMSSLSRELYSLRIQKNMTHKQVAEQAKLLTSFIRDYETGLIVPMKGPLKTLARVYGADYQKLWRLLDMVGKE